MTVNTALPVDNNGNALPVIHDITGANNWNIDSNDFGEVSIRGFPTAGIAIKNPTGTPVQVRLHDGTNSGPVGDAASRAIFITEAHYSYSHITADTAVKSGAGRLHTININGCSTAGTLTIYDSLTEASTIIAVIPIAINTNPLATLTYDVAFGTGLYLGFDATLVADLTVSYI